MKRILLLLALFALAFQACKKEEIPPVVDPKVLDLGGLTTASASGIILDESDDPVAGAFVTLGNKTVQTDVNGVFSIKNAQVRENLAQVKVQKGGYFFGSRTFRPKYEPNPFVRIKLLHRTIAGVIEAADGGAVEVSGAVTLDFQPSAIVDENGQAYAGSVQVAVQYLDPTASDLDRRMPGNLLGFSEEDGESSLATYGMVAVELIGSQGQKLQLAQGKPATLKVNVPAALLSGAPASIPLWYFDEEIGIWMEEGEAVLENGSYVGQVSHFSFWNCDANFPLVHMTGSVFFNDLANPMANVKVKLALASGSSTSYGFSDINGVFEGAIPKDEALLMEIKDLCGDVVYQAAIGPFSADVVLDPIILTSGSFTFLPVALSGTLVDCDGLPVTNGYIKGNTGEDTFIFFVDGTGSFESTLQVCSGGDIEITGVDLTNVVQSEAYTFPVAPEVETGPIQACDIELAEYIQFTLDGEDYLLTENIYLGDSVAGVSIAIFANGPNQTNWLNMAVNGAAVGTFPASQLVFYPSSGLGFTAQDPENVSVHITEYSSVVGELVKADFEGTFLDMSGGSHTIEGKFKAIRDF